MGPEAAGGPSSAYNLDKLFRSNSSGHSHDVSGDGPRAADARAEVMHIAANAAMSGTVSDEDRAYLAELVATKTGVSTDDAQKRIQAFIQSMKEASVQAKAAADEARKSGATAALYTALALLIGAFIASVSAAIGGRLRDEHS
jgi:Flp pilus assembly protein TadB